MTQLITSDDDEFNERYDEWKALIDKDIAKFLAKKNGKDDWSNIAYGHSKYRISYTLGFKKKSKI
jgi:hypothetical protein